MAIFCRCWLLSFTFQYGFHRLTLVLCHPGGIPRWPPRPMQLPKLQPGPLRPLGARTVTQDPSGSWCRLSGRLHPGDHTLYAFPCCFGRQVAAWAVQHAHQGGCHVSISCGGEVDGVAFRPDRQAWMTRKSENRVREIFVSGLFKNNDTFKRKYDMRQGSPWAEGWEGHLFIQRWKGEWMNEQAS